MENKIINLQNGDVLKLKNGDTMVYTDDRSWIINCYYDEDLRCLTNDEYTIVSVKRPSYEYIYKRIR